MSLDNRIRDAVKETSQNVSSLTRPEVSARRWRLRAIVGWVVGSVSFLALLGLTWLLLPTNREPFVAEGETVIRESPFLVVQAPLGPEPEFDTSGLGMDTNLTTTTDTSLIEEHYVTLGSELVKLTLLGTTPGGAQASIVYVDQQDALSSIVPESTKGTNRWVCVWTSRGDSDCGGGPVESYANEPGGLPPLSSEGVGYTVPGVATLHWRVPDATSVVVFTVNDISSWQRPLGQVAVFDTDFSYGDRFELVALDAQGRGIDKVEYIARGDQPEPPDNADTETVHVEGNLESLTSGLRTDLLLAMEATERPLFRWAAPLSLDPIFEYPEGFWIHEVDASGRYIVSRLITEEGDLIFRAGRIGSDLYNLGQGMDWVVFSPDQPGVLAWIDVSGSVPVLRVGDLTAPEPVVSTVALLEDATVIQDWSKAGMLINTDSISKLVDESGDVISEFDSRVDAISDDGTALMADVDSISVVTPQGSVVQVDIENENTAPGMNLTGWWLPSNGVFAVAVPDFNAYPTTMLYLVDTQGRVVEVNELDKVVAGRIIEWENLIAITASTPEQNFHIILWDVATGETATVTFHRHAVPIGQIPRG